MFGSSVIVGLDVVVNVLVLVWVGCSVAVAVFGGIVVLEGVIVLAGVTVLVELEIGEATVLVGTATLSVDSFVWQASRKNARIITRIRATTVRLGCLPPDFMEHTLHPCFGLNMSQTDSLQ